MQLLFQLKVYLILLSCFRRHPNFLFKVSAEIKKKINDANFLHKMLHHNESLFDLIGHVY